MPPLKTFDSHQIEYPIQSSGAESQVQRAQPPSANQLALESKGKFLSNQYAQKMLTNLYMLQQNSRFCDVEIRVGTRKFSAHRAVLSASSAYFEAMFRPELGLNEGKQRFVVLHSVHPAVLKMILDFIYTGRIDINQNNVQELLAAADMLQLHEVVEGCCDFLCRELDATNALGILRFAEDHHCEQLAQSAQQFVNSNFTQVAVEDEILDTPPTLLARILDSEYLRVDAEAQVFHAALRWFRHDVLHRRRFVFDIFKMVRLPLVPVQFIDQAICDCHDLSLRVALRSIRNDLLAKRGQLVPLFANPRISAKKSIFIFGGACRESSSGWNPGDCIFDSVAKYDIYSKEWCETAPMKIGRIQPRVAALNQKIFVIGGERGSQILANGEVYDPQNDSWLQISPMITPRCEFGLCTLGGTLMAVGGWVGIDIGGSMESYDPVKDVWTEVGEMPEARFSMGVVSFEGLIYVVGGCTSSSRHLADLICYNPKTREWASLASMKVARCQLGVAVLDRYLYVVGGNDKNQEVLRTVERYSFDEDKWEMVSPMKYNRASPSVAAVDGLLYVAGGDKTCEVNFYRAQVTINSMESYNPLTEEWAECTDLPMSRSEAGAVVL